MKEAFPKGLKVRVVPEAAGKHLFGREGEVQDWKEHGILQVLGSGSQLGVFVARSEHVQASSGFVKAAVPLNWKRMSKVLRQRWIWEAGFGDNETSLEEWKEFQEDACKDGPVRLWDGHIRLYQEYLMWSLQGTVDEVSMVHPVLVNLWVSAEDGGGEEQKQRIKGALLKVCRQGRIVCVPIWSQAGAEHWTLLVIDRTNRTCRYYDSLTVEHAGNKVAAFQVWELVREEDMPVALPEVRAGDARQGLLECGFSCATTWKAS